MQMVYCGSGKKQTEEKGVWGERILRSYLGCSLHYLACTTRRLLHRLLQLIGYFPASLCSLRTRDSREAALESRPQWEQTTRASLSKANCCFHRQNTQLTPTWVENYLHPTVSVTLTTALPKSFSASHSYSPASLNSTSLICNVLFPSVKLYLPLVLLNSWPLNLQVIFDGGKLLTRQVRLASSDWTTSAEMTSGIWGETAISSELFSSYSIFGGIIFRSCHATRDWSSS